MKLEASRPGGPPLAPRPVWPPVVRPVSAIVPRDVTAVKVHVGLALALAQKALAAELAAFFFSTKLRAHGAPFSHSRASPQALPSPRRTTPEHKAKTTEKYFEELKLTQSSVPQLIAGPSD